MPADQFLPAHDQCRSGAHPLPTLTGDAPGLSRVRAPLQRRGSKGGAGAPLTQAGAPAPDTYLGPTAAYGISVRSRASSPGITTERSTTMRRLTRTIQHLITGSGSAERSWVLRPAAQDAGQDHLHNDSEGDSPGSAMVPFQRDAPTDRAADEVDPQLQAAAAALVAEAVAMAWEGAR